MSERVAELPEELWKLVLRDVPLSDRFGSCAVVCQRLHAAAVAATDTIVTARPLKQPAVESFVAYLEQHGKHVTGITAGGAPPARAKPTYYPLQLGFQQPESTAGPPVVLEQLPSCQDLQDLCLKDFNLQLRPDGCHSGLLDNATGLTRLELTGCKSRSEESHIGDFTGLSVLVNLKDLRIADIEPNHHYFGPDTPCPFTCPGLSVMKHLTHLKLSRVRVQSADLRHVSCMSNLSVLYVSGSGCLRHDGAHPFVLPESLRGVYAGGFFLEPCVLAAATLLTRLELFDVRIEGQGDVYHNRHYYDSDSEDENERPLSGGASLLEMLSKLQHLDALSLSYLQAVWPPISPAYKALVASSKLQELRWHMCGLPTGVFAQLFSSESSCNMGFSTLKALRARHYDKVNEKGDNFAALDTPGVDKLVGCCPALQLLECEVFSGVDLTLLSRLTALTQLSLGLTGDDRDDMLMSVHSLAALTGLRHLSVELDNNCSLYGCRSLQPLTALRQLTDFSFRTLHSFKPTYDLVQRGQGDVPNVWLQLLGQCIDAIKRDLASQQDQVQRLEQNGDPTDEEQQEQQMMWPSWARESIKRLPCLAEARQELAELEREAAELEQQWQAWQHLAQWPWGEGAACSGHQGHHLRDAAVLLVVLPVPTVHGPPVVQLKTGW